MPVRLLKVACVLPLAFSVACAGTEGLPLRLVTWNVHGCQAGVEKIAEQLLELNPDLVCLQEVQSNDLHSPADHQCQELARQLGMNFVTSPPPGPANHEEQEAILFRGEISGAEVLFRHTGRSYGLAALIRWPPGGAALSSDLPLTAAGPAERPSAPGRTGECPPEGGLIREPYPRGRRGEGTLAVPGQDGECRRQIRIVCVHLTSNDTAGVGPFFETGITRLKELGRLCEHLDRWTGDMIMAGDFNAVPGMAEHGLLAVRMHWAPSLQFTHPSGFPILQLDHVFYRGDLQVTRIAASRSLAADHCPLVAEIRLTRPPAVESPPESATQP